MTGVVSVWEPQADHTLLVIDEIKVRSSLPHLSVVSSPSLLSSSGSFQSILTIFLRSLRPLDLWTTSESTQLASYSSPLSPKSSRSSILTSLKVSHKTPLLPPKFGESHERLLRNSLCSSPTYVLKIAERNSC